MSTNKQAVGFNVFAAILFAMQIVIDMLMGVWYAIRWENFRSLFNFINFGNVICVAFAVVLLMGKKDIATLVVSGVYFLFRAYYLIRYFSLFNVLYFLAAATLVFLVLITVLPALEQLRELKNVLFFVPAALTLLAFLISMLRYFHISLYTLGSLMYIGAFLCMGLWLKDGQTATVKAAPQPYIVPDGISPEDAQILRNFKNLVDKKLITPDVLAAKEQEILAKYNKTEE